MDDAKIKWEGYVRVIDINGKPAIGFRKLGADKEEVYIPDGFLEKKAVAGLIEKLK